MAFSTILKRKYKSCFIFFLNAKKHPKTTHRLGFSILWFFLIYLRKKEKKCWFSKMKADLKKQKTWRSAESDLRNAKNCIRVFRDFSIVQTTFCKSLDSSFLDSSFWGKMRNQEAGCRIVIYGYIESGWGLGIPQVHFPTPESRFPTSFWNSYWLETP